MTIIDLSQAGEWFRVPGVDMGALLSGAQRIAAVRDGPEIVHDHPAGQPCAATCCALGSHPPV